MTEIRIKEGDTVISMDCDMSLTEEAVDIMFRLLVLIGHHPDNVSSFFIERGESYIKTNGRL
jgi:hypothetical protein